MEFSPNNTIVKLCLQGMHMEDSGKPEEARKLFLQAWNDASNEYEKFLSAFFMARHQETYSEKLKWLETSLSFAIKANDEAVKSAFHSLYISIAKCYNDLKDARKEKEFTDLAFSFKKEPTEKGPFYHGTRADLKFNDLLTAGVNSNYKTDLAMNHIYFTKLISGAGLAASLAKGSGRERIYIVEPTGSFENDPNVTDKKFPGNLTRSYRSKSPLKIVDEITDWNKQTTE